MPLINIAAENADLAEDKKRKGVFFCENEDNFGSGFTAGPDLFGGLGQFPLAGGNGGTGNFSHV